MINTISNPNVANILASNSTQDGAVKNSEQPVQDKSSGRIIHDTVTLSPKAVETLEEHNKARNEAQRALTDKIMEKGFMAWAEEVNREKLEAEIRSQVLSSMGFDEDDFANLEAEVQQRIQNIIKERIREKIEQELAKDMDETNSEGTTAL